MHKGGPQKLVKFPEKSEKLTTFFGFVNCAARARARRPKERRKAEKIDKKNGGRKKKMDPGRKFAGRF